jgi:hypothetical protein
LPAATAVGRGISRGDNGVYVGVIVRWRVEGVGIAIVCSESGHSVQIE